MKRWLSVLLSCLLCWQAAALAAEPDLVLVAGSNSAVARLTADEVRKLYLGAPLFAADGQPIKPLRNNADSLLQEVFMQKVMFMSTPAYERQILSRVFRTGGNRPPVYTGLHQLVDALKVDPDAVSYMSRHDAQNTPGIKIISELWAPHE